MEIEIEEELCKHYENIHIQVEYLDIRRYTDLVKHQKHYKGFR